MDEPDTYVIATGVSHTIREFVQLAFDSVDLKWQDHVVVDQDLFRPAEVHELCGDASKAHSALGWRPTTSFADMVQMMVRSDLESVQENVK